MYSVWGTVGDNVNDGQKSHLKYVKEKQVKWVFGICLHCVPYVERIVCVLVMYQCGVRVCGSYRSCRVDGYGVLDSVWALF